jgi:DNA polymerase III delta prime subunit
MAELNDTIWSEKYRATAIDDLILPERLLSIFRNALEHPMQFPNMMFHSSGAGMMKTTTAEVLAKEMCKRYNTKYKKINSSQDGNKETIKDEIIEWGSYNGYTKAPKIVILDETDKCNAKTFLDPLLSTLESLNQSVRFIMTANSLQNFNQYSESRIEVFDFSVQNQDEGIELKKKMYKRLQDICIAEGVNYDVKTLQALIKEFYPDARMMMTRLYSCYLRNGEISGTSFSNRNSFDKYERLQELLLAGDFVSARNVYCSMPPENDIFTALMNDIVFKIQDPIKQMKVVCSIRKHMVPHNAVIDKEINIASMFAEIILTLRS